MKVSRRSWIVLAVVAVIAIFWFARRGGHETQKADEPPVVKAAVMTITQTPVDLREEIDGEVRPYQDAVLSPKIMSTVADVYVREGDRVEQGQALVRLEAADLNAQVSQAQAAVNSASATARGAKSAAAMEEQTALANIAQARAALLQAKAQQRIVRDGARHQEKAQASLAVEQAKAQYDLASSEAARMRRLFDQDVVTKQRLEQAVAAEAVAKAAWNSAKQQSGLVMEGSRREEVKAADERVRQAEATLKAAESGLLGARMRRDQATAAQAQLGQAKAALSGAKAQAGYAYIRAPFSGVVTARYVDPGDQAAPGAPVIAVEDRSQWRVEADVAESAGVKLKPGMPANVKIDSLNGVVVAGRIVEVRPSGDSRSRTSKIKVSISPRHNLKSGLFARVLLPGGQQEAIVVPADAVIDGNGFPRVWVVSDQQTAMLRLVTVGKKSESGVIILSGLSRGERIVVSNLDKLTEGAKVEAL